MMKELFGLQEPPAVHTAMHYHIFTLEELEQAWEAKKGMSVRQNSEVSVTSIEDLITWDSAIDRQNPKNWSTGKKWLNVLIVSLQATLTTAASSILATGLQSISQYFQIGDNVDIKGLPIAVFVLGFGLGPLFLAPLSEQFGRRIVYIVSLAMFTTFSTLCALAPSFSALCTFRFFAGVAGSTSATLGAGSVGDLFDKKARGFAQAVYAFGPTMGAVLGALIGGFILVATPGRKDWRWMEWAIVIGSGFMTLVNILFLRESYGPYLLAQKAKRLQRAIGNPHLMPPAKTDLGELFMVTLTRPIRMLLFAPVCTILSMYMGLVQGVMYLSMVAMPLLFGPKDPRMPLFTYEFHTAYGGLSLLAAGLGIILGVAFCMLFSNRIYHFMRNRYVKRFMAFNGHDDSCTLAEELQTHSPDFRTPLMQLGMVIVPIGLFIFAIYSFGMILAYVSIQTYMVDTFDDYAASAVAAGVVMRGLLGCVFTVVGFRLFEDKNRSRLPAEIQVHWEIKVEKNMPVMVVVLRDHATQNVLHATCMATYAGETSSQGAADILEACSAMENKSSGSNASFSLSQYWLDQCLEKHETCPKPGTYLPTRVIDVGPSDGSREPRLYDTSKETGELQDHERRYVALSYCWGPPPWFRTEKAVFDSLREAIPMKDLPGTLREAVVVTRVMGLRFLWIDALCIIQDDPDDWATEAATMCTVYQKAIFTITAARASTCTGGLFAERDGVRVLPFMLEVSLATRTAHCQFTPMPRREIVWGMEDLMLYNRAWVLQEMILSTRALIYDPDCVRWECLATSGSERAVNGGIIRHHSRVRKLQLAISQKPSIDQLIPFPGDDIIDQASGWHHIVQDYMIRGITNTRDRLIAVYGVAKVLSIATRYTYLAGMWEEFLPLDLAWFVRRLRRGVSTTNVKTFVDKPLPYRATETVAPSWSWASVNTPVEYPSFLHTLGICRVVSATTQGSPEAVTGHLTIEGHTRTMYILSEKPSIINEAFDSVKNNKYTYHDSHGFKQHLAEPDEVIFVSPNQPELIRAKAQPVPGRWYPEEFIDARIPITFLALILRPYLPSMPVESGSQAVFSIALVPTGSDNEYKRIGFAEWRDCAWFGHECGPHRGSKRDGYSNMSKSWGRIKPPDLCDARTAIHTDARHTIGTNDGFLDEDAYHANARMIRQTLTIV
ncbi:hypothetical protein FKW77_005064 [Venturia effusa]|uniref:Major facilitator superfamily (MFS) profile domain-containing protein n=1 Tax=Venturia effusa TaxID=50376 RepID=A0A517LK60_9PEZI|nr:hypothetical protein FKW77_005064 [Venturia effusa]